MAESYTVELTTEELAAISDAVDILDELWRLDAARGLRDGLGGSEYQRTSTAPALSSVLDKANAQDAAIGV